MKVVILAGGYGTRLEEDTITKPKPMVEIGGKPIIWHIMKIYSSFGYNDFIVLCGYKGYVLKEYFSNFYRYNYNCIIDLKNNKTTYPLSNMSENWKVTLIDTGLATKTGGRIKRAEDIIGNETFMLTYGDGLGNINIKKLLSFHRKRNNMITITSARPKGRFGSLKINDRDQVLEFNEKPDEEDNWINAGFFVCEPQIFKYIDDDETTFEREPLIRLSKNNELFTYKHNGFWKPMDTPKDKIELNEMWNSNNAKWKTW